MGSLHTDLLGQTHFLWDIGLSLNNDKVVQELGIRWYLLDGIQKWEFDLNLLEHLQNVLKFPSFLRCLQFVWVRCLRYKRSRRNLNSGSGCRWLRISLLCVATLLPLRYSRVLFRKNHLHMLLPMHNIRRTSPTELQLRIRYRLTGELSLFYLT